MSRKGHLRIARQFHWRERTTEKAHPVGMPEPVFALQQRKSPSTFLMPAEDHAFFRQMFQDECPFPTLAATPRSAHGSTRLQCPVRLYAMLGIRCTGRNRTG